MNKAFKKILERLEREIAGKPTPDEYNNGINRAYSIVREVEEEFATDTNVGTNGWIACSDQLPEENQEVILQDFYGNITIEKMKINDGAKGFSDGNWWSSANNYVAWRPLPEPYNHAN